MSNLIFLDIRFDLSHPDFNGVAVINYLANNDTKFLRTMSINFSFGA